MKEMQDSHRRAGFTLIEILIVVAISAVLSALAIVYSQQGQTQVALSIEQEKVAQIILEAKELSIATYSKGSGTCAYGVRFNFASSTYTLFAYDSIPKGQVFCPSLASTTANGVIAGDMTAYTSSTANMHTGQGVVLQSTPAASVLEDVLFYPPNPDTLVSHDGKTWAKGTANVYLKTSNGSASAQVSVNPAGQVGF